MLAKVKRGASANHDGSGGSGQFDVEPEGDDGLCACVLKSLAEGALAGYDGCDFELSLS